MLRGRLERTVLAGSFALVLGTASCGSESAGGAAGADAGSGGDASTDGSSRIDAGADGRVDDSGGDAIGGDDGAADADSGPRGPVAYVATTGDDSAAGTLAAPWKTISHAMNTVTAGYTVMVRAGVYSELVDIGVSGTAGSPITLQSYPGEQAIVDGTTVQVVDGLGLIDIDGQSHLVVSGLEIRSWTSTTSDVPAGIFIHGGATDVELVGNHVHDIVTTVESCNGSGGNAFGIAVYGNNTIPISALVIHGNEVDNLRTGCSESMTINGNVDGFEVSNNLVHDNDNIGIDAIGYEGTAPTTALDVARNGAIRQNTVYNITSQNNAAYDGLGADGIYVDGGQNLVIEENIVHNVDLGIEMASEHSGHTASYVVARNNVVYYSNSAGASIGGYDTSVGGTDHCALMNNTFYENVTELSMNAHISTVLFENNVLYDSSASFQDGSATGVSIDHDLDLQTGAASVFVNPGTAPNGAIAVDLHVAAATLAQVKDLGIEVACPAGWTCPGIWGASLNGTADVAGSTRESAAGIDLGAYQSP
jgi:hypothetical protein